MSKLLYDLHELDKAKYQFSIFDDFFWLISPHMWTTILTDSGSVTVANGVGGIAPLVASDGSVVDNDETYLHTTNKPFKFVNNQRIAAECRLQFTEAATDDANIAFGMASTIGANNIVDDGAGLLTNFDGFAIYKVDGGTVWKCISSKGTTQTITASVGNGVTAAAGGSSYQILRIEFIPGPNSLADVHFFLDGLQLLDSNNKAIVHRGLDYSSSPLAMCMWAGVKNGSANNETLNVDYMGGYQGRL